MGNIYCDFSSGNDSTGDGTSGNPYKTLQVAINDAAPVTNSGDTVWVGDTSAEVLTTSIYFDSMGAVSNRYHLVIRGWDISAGATSAGTATIDGNDAVSTIFVAGKSGINLLNLKFMSATGNLLDMGAQCQLYECELTDWGTAAWDIANDAILINNYIHDDGGSSLDGVSLGANNIVIGNEFKNISGISIGSTTNENTIIGNLIYGGSEQAINLSNSDRILILNNTLVGKSISGQNAINLNGSANDENFILNNLIVDWGTGGVGGGVEVGTGSSLSIVGNNHFHNISEANYIGKEVNGLDLTANDTSGDPLFKDAASGDYKLGANSPAKNTGYPAAIGSQNTVTSIDAGAAQAASTTLRRAWIC